jgi:hypothetical protein
LKAALRIVAILLAGTKPQRWCLGLALGLLVLTPKLSTLVCRCSDAWPSWSTALRFLPVMLLGPALLLGSSMFRRISDLRGTRLIPGSSEKLLLGLILAQAIAAAVMATDAAVPHAHTSMGTARDQSPFTVFELSFAFASLWTLSIYVFSAASRWTPVAFALCLGLLGFGAWLLTALTVGSDPADHAKWSNADSLAMATVAVWTLFSFWFLRRPPPARLSPERASPRSGVDDWLNAFLAGADSPAAVYLGRRAAVSRNTLRLLFVFGLMHVTQVLLICSQYIWPLQHHSAPNFASPALVLPNFVLLIAYVQSRAIARGSRSLWIRGGRTRLELFAASERLSLRSLAFVAGLLFVPAAAEWALLPHRFFDTGEFLYMTLTCAECAPLAAYLGLRNFRGAALDVFIVMLQFAVFVWGFSEFTGDGESPLSAWLHWIVPLLLPGVVLVLRQLVRAQWSRVDWLSCVADKDPGPLFPRSA